ncbi:MAG: FtsK/SpoIIIE domain-containing protein, partial [Anaerolineales bacterium]
MSLGFPVANLFGLRSQQKAYQQQLRRREQAYLQKLTEIRQQLETLARQQRQALEEAYPPLSALYQIAQAADKRLWARRPSDEDFLALRIGTGEGVASFVVEPPRYSVPEDALVAQGGALAGEFQKLANLPYLLDLASTGSLAIGGRMTAIYALTRRLVIDLLVHHSPQDVQVIVLTDTRQGMAEWEWLKWAPHTDALNPEKHISFMAFDPLAAERTMEFVMGEYHRRRAQGQGWQASDRKTGGQTAFVLLVDDSGSLRQRTDMRTLAEWGHEVSIYPIFIGGRDWPRECRARLDAIDESLFRFTKMGSSAGEPHQGRYESASAQDCERIVRALAGWTVSAGETRLPLPESIRLSRVLGLAALSPQAIQHAWSMRFEPDDLLQLPIGVYARRDRLDLAVLNLLPAAYGGKDAYHTILIGTTGSGKSELMKSLVFGAAVRYPPSVLNFFFMDFKGGAAFNIFSELPHVSGIVTNLSPELVERGLDSIRNEIERRQSEFASADPGGKRIQNIWDYNRANPERPMPHLILFLDEFARGLADFPRLRETLDVLVRQGRSLGMYLILANQDVNSEVDKLLNNVGWRIALKVAKPEEMHMIDRFLPSPVRAGQGYLRLSSGGSEIIEFQAGYGGLPVQLESTSREGEDFSIYEVQADGSYREVWRKRNVSTAGPEASASGPVLKEEEYILHNIRQAAEALQIRPAKRIYLDPLPATIPFEQVMEEAGIQPAFQGKKWQPLEDLPLVVAYWGKLDLPEQCLQETLTIDFDDKDGHLWMIGAPKS